MIRYIITDSDGAILRDGHASTLVGAFLQCGDGERAFAVPGPDIGLIDRSRLKINFNNLLISRNEGVTEDVQGNGASVLEIVQDDTDA